ncbi:hypothetical protein C8C77_10410 [Halanaerobium saccharolyticum]|uniref:Uncharacterized protein n=1 Tax=Halanaerobium saccharolyticum TaxID=43595 RepID=A0A4R7Z9M6_9FIRM|nr:hypothetical protein [Halanaerobium saccharolyticum]RAK10621.1 hypothetical protein C7958_104142 [Halanaerobium saccharolyticum]TDW06622.1 hypothetical protein C8C77_10410 [Halanaerobium saccharolyticum]TDX62257.1 hypothetical protein C7956_10410 [Halanaerobium saccharolyticum]
MKKIVVELSIGLFLILVFSSNIYAQTQKESLNMLININPYINLEIGEDINISVDQPWQGGEVREASSKLYLKTNTAVELSWETTKLSNEKTGRSLPLGIPIEFIQRLVRGETVKAADQPFGLNTFLINKGNYQDDSLIGRKKENDYSILASELKDGNVLQSSQGYRLEPGVYNFDIIVQYYWARESSWSQITAGEYKGQIIYTVAAVNDGSE